MHYVEPFILHIGQNIHQASKGLTGLLTSGGVLKNCCMFFKKKIISRVSLVSPKTNALNNRFLN